MTPSHVPEQFDRTMGCTWTGTECTGMARECATIVDAAECTAQPGCTLGARAQCRGTARECATLPAATDDGQRRYDAVAALLG